jgi:hypothetical protein
MPIWALVLLSILLVLSGCSLGSKLLRTKFSVEGNDARLLPKVDQEINGIARSDKMSLVEECPIPMSEPIKQAPLDNSELEMADKEDRIRTNHMLTRWRKSETPISSHVLREFLKDCFPEKKRQSSDHLQKVVDHYCEPFDIHTAGDLYDVMTITFRRRYLLRRNISTTYADYEIHRAVTFLHPDELFNITFESSNEAVRSAFYEILPEQDLEVF